MQVEDFIKTGQLSEALAAAEKQVRSNPAEVKYRVMLFQLLAVLGDWKRAGTQLNVVAEMGEGNLLFAHMYKPALMCEALRHQVFNSGRSPLVFGEPQPWIGLLIQSNQLLVQEQYQAAADLQAQAFEQAPARPGKINEQPFEWIADADSRLGPVLEAIIDGKYYWVPMSAIQRIHIESPTDLRDLVWVDAVFTWINGGESSSLIPVRYPDTQNQPDDGLKLARKTIWDQPAEAFYTGLGQRILATDAEEFPLLEIRDIVFEA